MLRITVELVYQGDESKKSLLGVLEIGNDGTGSQDSGNYNVRADYEDGHFLTGKVKNFPRKELGPMHLVRAAVTSLYPGLYGAKQ